MRDVSIAANYAEALLDLATRSGNPHDWGAMLGDIAAAVERDTRLRRFLESPRVSQTAKSDILAQALHDRVPRLFLRFLQTLVRHRRQRLLSEIVAEYNRLLDALEGRVHADVTVARPLDAQGTAALAERLTQAMGNGKRVAPVVRVFPPIMGGVIVRMGDRVADGSVRTRLAHLRRRLAAAR